MSVTTAVIWIFRSDRTLEQLKFATDALAAAGLPPSTSVTVHALREGDTEGVTLPAGMPVVDPITGLSSGTLDGVVTYSTCPEAGILAMLG